MRSRDTQRGRVYKSDHALDTHGRLETVEEIEAFTAKLWKSERFKKAFPSAASYREGPPDIRDGRGRRRACGSTYYIKMPKWSRTKGVVCHELAHTVHLRSQRKCTAWHGWEFCSIYLKLVLYSMGREAHDALKAAFRLNKVRFTEPRKRKPMSYEQKEVLRARLEEARAAKRVKYIKETPGPVDASQYLARELNRFFS